VTNELILHEVYLKNPLTGESGWDIQYVLSRKEDIQTLPNLDTVISRGYNGFSPYSITVWDGKTARKFFTARAEKTK